MTTQIFLNHQNCVKYYGYNLVGNLLQVTLMKLMAGITRGWYYSASTYLTKFTASLPLEFHCIQSQASTENYSKQDPSSGTLVV